MNKKVAKWFIVEIIIVLVTITCYTVIYYTDNVAGQLGIIVTYIDFFIKGFIFYSFSFFGYLFLLSLLNIILSLIFLGVFKKSDKKQAMQYWVLFSLYNLVFSLLFDIGISIFNRGYCVAFC